MGVDDLFIENDLRHVDENFLVFLEAIGAVLTRFEFVWKATLREQVEAKRTTQTAEERERERAREPVAENVKTTTSGKSLKSI
jgi:ABC-type lipoprotein export system ATPase subunit